MLINKDGKWVDIGGSNVKGVGDFRRNTLRSTFAVKRVVDKLKKSSKWAGERYIRGISLHQNQAENLREVNKSEQEMKQEIGKRQPIDEKFIKKLKGEVMNLTLTDKEVKELIWVIKSYIRSVKSNHIIDRILKELEQSK